MRALALTETIGDLNPIIDLSGIHELDAAALKILISDTELLLDVTLKDIPHQSPVEKAAAVERWTLERDVLRGELHRRLESTK